MAPSNRPCGLIGQTGIELLTCNTPNGVKISILLEELKEAYGLDYVYQNIDIMENIQKEPWFTRHSPNGRIPAIVDHDREQFSVFETAAILMYLTRHYDPEHKFSFCDTNDISRSEQWVAWQHGGLGPMQGQANHFYRIIKDEISYPTQRYIGETERLYGVLDTQLKGRDYLVGPDRGRYSIADIASFGWVNTSYFSGIILSKFPNVERWWKKIRDRPAVQMGIRIPEPSQVQNGRIQERLEEEPLFKAEDDDRRMAGDRAKKQFNYKFSSP
ncbi:hypothetical protein ACSS6W_004256 [Trichoderma asperelloides]